MKIAFSKNGKSIKFNSEKFSPTGGDNEASQCLRLLANNNPDIVFYIVGRSDYSKLTGAQKSELFNYDNVIDVWSSFKGSKADFARTDVYLLDYFKDIKIDAHVMMIGQIGAITIPGKIKQIKDSSLVCSVIDMTHGYSSPINIWMNTRLDIPVIEICNDPRYRLDQARDMIFIPKVSLSQYDEEYIKRHIISYTNQEMIYTPVMQKYAEMEKIFLYGRNIPEINVKQRTTNFSIVLNEGSPSRYKLLQHWILNKFPDVSIFGSWDEKYTKDDFRFQGSLKLENLHTVMQNCRSTFCIPIKTGWVTSKYIESIYSGVVPFFHPTYDDQNHTKVPDFLRVQTKEDLYERIELLKDDSFYLKTITELQRQFLRPEYLDGSELNHIIMSEVYEGYKQQDILEKQNSITSLEDLM